jgi:hypothetical protein
MYIKIKSTKANESTSKQPKEKTNANNQQKKKGNNPMQMGPMVMK